MAPSRQADNRNVVLWFQDLASHVLWSVSRPAEVQPWEVRFAHPCRARARHPIHKAMGGHASHGRTFDLAFMKRGYGEETVVLDSVVICDFESLNFRKVKRPWKVPFSGRIR